MSQRQRAKKKVRVFGHSDLKQVCRPVTEDDDIEAIEAEMRKVLKAFHDGIGLAAPQIGHLVRAVLVRDQFLVNPVVKSSAPATNTIREGCLSYPDHYCDVERAQAVHVTHRDGEEVFRGLEAAIVQHELDHLDGVCKVGDDWRKSQ